jgi:ligand-binding sensor domain-containing protein/two-component sensor histidine kinase
MWTLCLLIWLQQLDQRPDYRFVPVEGSTMSVITAMHQDRAGLLWFGSLLGLDRYDGYRFTHFHHDPTTLGTLSTPLVNTVSSDPSGTIWVGTEKGVDLLLPGATEFNHFKPAAEDYRVLDILSASDGAMWVTTEKGLYLYEAPYASGEKVFELTPPDAPFFFQPILELADKIWLGTPKGLMRVDLTGQNPTWIPLKEGEPAAVVDLAKDRQQSLWLATDQGLFQLDSQTGTVHDWHDGSQPLAQPLPGKDIRSVVVDAQDQLWIGIKDKGISLLNADRSNYFLYQREPGRTHCIQAESIDIMMVDRAGLIWMGSSGFGLTRCNPATTQFEAFPQTGDATGPPGLITWAFFEDQNDTLYVASTRGLSRFDRELKRFASLSLPDPIPSSANIRYVIGDDQGVLWLSSFDFGLIRYEAPGTGKVYLPDGSGQDGQQIIIGPVLPDPKGFFWVGTRNGGLFKFDPGTETFKAEPLESDSESKIEPGITKLLMDSRQQIWAGTAEHGIYKSEPNGMWHHFIDLCTVYETLPKSYVLDLMEDRKGQIWIGLINEGLGRLSGGGTTFHVFNSNHGLANDTTYAILEDEQGFIWVTTNAGLSRFDPEQETFVNFYPSDGLVAREGNGAATLFSRDGFAYFGAAGGLTRFRPEAVIPSAQPELMISHYRIAHNPLTSITTGTALEFHAGQPVISFGFSQSDYRNSAHNRFAYRIESVSPDWLTLGESNEVTFTKLPAGRHRLEMIGANSHGIWNRDSVHIDFFVRPPWWMSAWIEPLYLLAFLSILFWFWRWREGKLAFQLAVERAELKALQAQINPHFLFNTLNSIAELIPQKPEEAEDVVLQLSDYFRDTLRISQNLEIQLAQEVQIIRDYLTLEKVRFGDRLFFSLSVDPELEMIIIPGLIIQPLVENTMKYALPKLMKPGHIAVSVFRQDGSMVIECRDNGPGFPSQWRQGGFGLTSIEQRLRHFFGKKASLTVLNEKGAVVRLHIPLKYCRT